MSTITVFWPIDVQQDGFCYGWQEPCICIAGVFAGHSGTDAEAWLATRKRQYSIYTTPSCGSELAVLGKCSFATSQPSLPFVRSKYTVIYYHRHTSTTWRYRILGAQIVDVCTESDALVNLCAKVVAHNFALTQWRDTSRPGLNSVVLDQFNTAGAVANLLCMGLPMKHGLNSLAWRLSDVLDVLNAGQQKVTHRSWGQTAIQLQHVSRTLQSIWSLINAKSNDATIISQRIYCSNALCLLLNDATLGIMLSIFLQDNNTFLCRALASAIQDGPFRWIYNMLIWLDSWPAGLKLNTNLSYFYSHLIRGIILMWQGCLWRLLPHLTDLINVLAITSYGGLSTTIALTTDILRVITLPIQLSHKMAAAVHLHLVNMLLSLWNLFQGKRYNALQHRIDSWKYDVDQLFLGTVLFALITLLLPTVTAYYLLLLFVHMLIKLGSALLSLGCSFLNQFPLLGLVVWIKNPYVSSDKLYTTRSLRRDAKVITMQKASVSPCSVVLICLQLVWNTVSNTNETSCL